MCITFAIACSDSFPKFHLSHRQNMSGSAWTQKAEMQSRLRRCWIWYHGARETKARRRALYMRVWCFVLVLTSRSSHQCPHTVDCRLSRAEKCQLCTSVVRHHAKQRLATVCAAHHLDQVRDFALRGCGTVDRRHCIYHNYTPITAIQCDNGAAVVAASRLFLPPLKPSDDQLAEVLRVDVASTVSPYIGGPCNANLQTNEFNVTICSKLFKFARLMTLMRHE